jgi:hypothetical protein
MRGMVIYNKSLSPSKEGHDNYRDIISPQEIPHISQSGLGIHIFRDFGIRKGIKSTALCSETQVQSHLVNMVVQSTLLNMISSTLFQTLDI